MAGGYVAGTDPHLDPHERYSVCFGATVRARRAALGLSQTQLAAGVGLSRMAVQFIECGVRSPSGVTQSRLAAALGVSVAELVAEAERRRREAA